MARTALEDRIRTRRATKGFLVPIMTEILERPLSIDDDKDRQFMIDLMNARAREREKGVFSPSMLGSCMRQAFFAKTGVEKHHATSPKTNSYFIDGDFRHYKLQFMLWKAHRRGLLTLHGCEIRVYHPNGDFAGTIDAIVSLPQFGDEMFVVDFKGMRVDDFQTFQRYGTPLNYKIQIVGYGTIVNAACSFESFMGTFLGVKIKRCLLVGESKGGPSTLASIGLHEDVISVNKMRAKVKARIGLLRRYVSAKETPPITCHSTGLKGFQECPFSRLCLDEVRDEQQRRKAAKAGDTAKRTLATPVRDAADRSRERKRGRKKHSA